MTITNASTQRTGYRHSRTTLALAITILLFAGSTFVSADAATNQQVSVARVTRLDPGDAVIGALPLNQPVRITVALTMRDRAGLEALIADNARKQRSGIAPQLLSPADFLATHAPTQAQAQAVADYLVRMGYTHVSIAPNRLLVSAVGTAATARNAFATTLAQVRTHDGRIAYANTDEVRIPAALADKVLAVVGLQNVHQGSTRAPHAGAPPQMPIYYIAHMPGEFPAIYGGSTAPVAADIVVGIVTEGNQDLAISDLNTFTTFANLPTVATQTIGTDYSGDLPGGQSAGTESQAIVGMAGGQLRRLMFYVTPGLSDVEVTDNLDNVVARGDAKVIEVSFGVCETDAQADGSAAADDAILATAVAQGQTFAVGAGDVGVDECRDGTQTPLWPASSQYVVAVTGTHLNANATTWYGEKTWVDTGGSPSTFEPMPSWQSAFGVPGTTRGAADIAFDADIETGIKVFEDNVLMHAGGTELSTALFVGSWARVLEANGKGFGFAAPILYGLPATDFHDIVVGDNNGIPNSHLGFAAAPGYDFSSGRGSLLIDNVIADSKSLGNQPPVADFSYAATGLNVSFTDTSTDPDGTIAAHAWRFGDGATSTAANPSHTYSSYKNYQATEIVTDNNGTQTAITKEVSLALAPLQLLEDHSFELRGADWQVTKTRANDVQFINNQPYAYAGNWYVLTIPETGTGSDLSQQVTLPSIYAKATLRVPVWIENGNPAPKTAVNHLNVQVIDPSTGTVLATLGSLNNLEGRGCISFCTNYVLHYYDMTPYIGQTVILNFNMTADDPSEAFFTYFNLDDITLTVR